MTNEETTEAKEKEFADNVQKYSNIMDNAYIEDRPPEVIAKEKVIVSNVQKFLDKNEVKCTQCGARLEALRVRSDYGNDCYEVLGLCPACGHGTRGHHKSDGSPCD